MSVILNDPNTQQAKVHLDPEPPHRTTHLTLERVPTDDFDVICQLVAQCHARIQALEEQLADLNSTRL